MNNELNEWELYFNKANYYRGLVITDFTTLERTIENIIASYFVSDKNLQNDLKSVVIDRLTFESKRAALRYLSDREEIKKGFKKTKNNSYPNKEIFNEIRRLIDERNYFAHYHIMIVGNDPEKYLICLSEFRDAGNSYRYDNSGIENLRGRISKAVRDITDLWRGYKPDTGGA